MLTNPHPPLLTALSLNHFQQILIQAIAMNQENVSVYLAMLERTVMLVCLTVLYIGYGTTVRPSTGVHM